MGSELPTKIDSLLPDNRDYMCKVLLEMERDVHRGGWDKPPRLYAITGRGDMTNGWTRESLLEDEFFWNLDPNPRNVMTTYASFLAGTWPPPGAKPHPGLMIPPQFSADATRSFVLDGLARDGLHAIVFISEAWMLIADPNTARDRTKAIADTVGGKEIRTVVAVAPDSTVYQVQRIRGQKPTVLWLHQASGDSGGQFDEVLGGRVTNEAPKTITGLMTNILRVMVNLVNERSGIPPVELKFGEGEEERINRILHGHTGASE